MSHAAHQLMQTRSATKRLKSRSNVKAILGHSSQQAAVLTNTHLVAWILSFLPLDANLFVCAAHVNAVFRAAARVPSLFRVIDLRWHRQWGENVDVVQRLIKMAGAQLQSLTTRVANGVGVRQNFDGAIAPCILALKPTHLQRVINLADVVYFPWQLRRTAVLVRTAGASVQVGHMCTNQEAAYYSQTLLSCGGNQVQVSVGHCIVAKLVAGVGNSKFDCRCADCGKAANSEFSNLFALLDSDSFWFCWTCSGTYCRDCRVPWKCRRCPAAVCAHNENGAIVCQGKTNKSVRVHCADAWDTLSAYCDRCTAHLCPLCTRSCPKCPTNWCVSCYHHHKCSQSDCDRDYSE
jgi:hypothetical protein